MVKIILLDVDETLYPKGTGPFTEVNRRIDRYVMASCKIDLDAARRLRNNYIESYGSTLQGLMHHYGIDPGNYLKDVHDVPVEELLHRDKKLHETLEALACRLVAFTNGSLDYARRILKVLDIDDVIHDLFTIEYMDFVPKPLPWAYHKVIQQYGGCSQDYLVVDDSLANARTARKVGMAAVLIGVSDPEGILLSVPDIYEIPSLVSDAF